MLGLALDPQFADNQLVYLYFTTPTAMKLERWRFHDDTLTREGDLIDGTIQAGTIHDSGRIAFGPDDDLYVATGEAGQPELAQDPSSLNGKYLRLTPDQYHGGPSTAGDRVARPPQPAGLRLAAGHRPPRSRPSTARRAATGPRGTTRSTTSARATTTAGRRSTAPTTAASPRR